MRTNTFVNHGGFPLRAAMDLLCSFLQTPTVHYMVNWQPFASMWIYSHPTACRSMFLLPPVLQTTFKCASWVICLMPTLAASLWTNFCLRSCCVPRISVFHVAPAELPVFDPRSPGDGGCLSIMCWCGIGEEDDNGGSGKRWGLNFELHVRME